MDAQCSRDALPPEYFTRHDNSDDSTFYKVPRRIAYLDPGAVTAVGRLCLGVLPAGGTYLDLMTGWRSYIPEELRPANVIGLGLNAQEMAENGQLDESVVHDLNREPSLPFRPLTFDAVLCSLSVQYLVRPVEVFAEVERVLKPHCPFVVLFSHHCYPRKTIAIWLAMNSVQRTALVSTYFRASGKWGDINVRELIPDADLPRPSKSLHAVWAVKQ